MGLTMDLMSDAGRIAEELRAAGLEMQDCCVKMDLRAAQRAHLRHLAQAFELEETVAMGLRDAWHEQDLSAEEGIFFEAVSETVNRYRAELYPLMLFAPQEFGRRLAVLVQEYADRTARHQAH